MLDTIVNLTITKATANLSRQGFGGMAFAACHTYWADRVKTFGAKILDELVALGVATTHPIYLWASAARAQNPAPKEFYILKRTRLPTEVFTLTVVGTPVAGEVFAVTIDGTEVEVTADSNPTAAEVSAALQTAIDALADLTAVDASPTVTVTRGTAGKFTRIEDRSKNLALKYTQVNPGGGGIEGDLADAKVINNSWYGLQIDSPGKAEIVAAAEWAESNKKLFGASTSDTEVTDAAVTDDVASSLQDSNLARTFICYHPEPLHYLGARLMGKQFPKDPGSTNWAHQQLSAESYELTSAQITALTGKNCNFFITTAGLSTTFWGKTASGEWIDDQHFIDWMAARTRERYSAFLVSVEKVPYTQDGIDTLGDLLRAQFAQGVKKGGLDGGSPIVIEVPLLADIDAVERAARNVPDIRGQGRLAGGINTLDISVSLTV